MLEFKNVSVALPDGGASTPFSVVVGGGELVCIQGPAGSGRTRLLLSVMGLSPVRSGYITVDGELVTAGSAAYFRQLMAYVPQHVPDGEMTVGELCATVMRLEAHAGQTWSREILATQWQRLGLDPSIHDADLRSLAPLQLQCALIGLLPLIRRNIILVDDVPQTQEVFVLLREMATAGSEVVFTTDSASLPCDKLIKL